jgi:hypothetical protein
MKKFNLLFAFFLLFCFSSFSQKVGDKVDVLWNGAYYKATVKQVNDTKWFIHYDGYESSWDEWVGKDRIKVTNTSGGNTGGKTDAKTSNSNSGGKTDAGSGGSTPTWKVGDKIKVEWNSTWYPSTILQVGDGKYKIHYDGWASSYDEWVTPARMKNK